MTFVIVNFGFIYKNDAKVLPYKFFFKDKINSLVCKKQKQIVFAELYPRFDSYFAKIALL